MLVVIAFFFGSTFLIVQDAVRDVAVAPFLAARFGIAALVLAPFAMRRPASPGELRDGAAAGVALLAGYAFQTIGLQYTTSSTSAFITYMCVVFVPVIGLIVHRRRPDSMTVIGIAIAVVGLALLTGGGRGADLGKGELFTLGCAICFAIHFVILGHIAARHDPVRITAIQMTVVAAASFVPSAAQGQLHFSTAALVAAAFTGVFATALAFLFQVMAQQVVSAARTALVLLLEPVFAAALGYADGERLGATRLVGAALILTAVVVAEVLPNLSRPGSA
jgi:drug/metabolite transporter (DMT)-like permease